MEAHLLQQKKSPLPVKGTAWDVTLLLFGFCVSQKTGQCLNLSEEERQQADTKDIAAIRQGNNRVYLRIIERYQEEIARQMRRFSRESAIVEELTHDVFVEAYLSLPKFRGNAPLLHWLRKIALRVGYNYWTQRNARQSHEVTLAPEDWQRLNDTHALPERASEAAELAFTLLAQLPSKDRLALTLIYLEGYSLDEVAQLTGWTLTGTKVRAFRARNRLRKLMESEAR